MIDTNSHETPPKKKNKNKNNQQTKTKKSPTIATPKAKYNPTTSDAMKVTMLEQQNEILQQQIQQMKHNINILLKNKDQDIETIQNLQRNQKKNNKRKSRKPPTHFDFIAKSIAKKTLFPMIKFVSNKDLEIYDHPQSIGFNFLQALKKEDQVKDSVLFEGNDEILWKNAKNLVKDALSEKRNARQTEIKKSWKGLFILYIFYILFIYYIYSY